MQSESITYILLCGSVKYLNSIQRCLQIWICKNDNVLKIVDFNIQVHCLLTDALNYINSFQLRTSLNQRKCIYTHLHFHAIKTNLVLQNKEISLTIQGTMFANYYIRNLTCQIYIPKLQFQTSINFLQHVVRNIFSFWVCFTRDYIFYSLYVCSLPYTATWENRSSKVWFNQNIESRNFSKKLWINSSRTGF